MNKAPLLFLGIFFTLAFSWTGIVLVSHLQIGGLEHHVDEATGEEYPPPVSGIAQRGKEVYMDLGCLYCHSQQVRRPGFGADDGRNWGSRQSVPRDYINQEVVQLGTMRTGPDLTTIGQRQPSRDWHHLHLYNPQITSAGSNMPPYPYLYETRPIENGGSPQALNLPEPYVPPEGYEVVPTARAEALVEYLLSLKMDYDLPEAPR